MIDLKLIQPEDLAMNLDMLGNEIVPGTRVLSLDCPLMLDDGRFLGLERGGIVGVVRGYKNIEGCARYEIEVEARYWDGEVAQNDKPLSDSRFVYPPVNGLPSMVGRNTCGVFAYEGPHA